MFEEIDVDANGVIDKVEFRNLLTTLSLGYSDKRFNRLFKAVDTKASGKIGISELENLIFPSQHKVKKDKRESFSIANLVHN